MTATKMEHQQLLNLVSELMTLEHSASLLKWDHYTHGSKKGLHTRANVMGQLAERTHTLMTNKTNATLLQEVVIEEVPEAMRPTVLYLQKESTRLNKIPRKLYTSYEKMAAKAPALWQEARQKNDFSHFRPLFDRFVIWQMDLADELGYTSNRYDAILGLRQEGLTTAQLDQWFGRIKKELTPIVQYAKSSDKKIKTGFLYEDVDASTHQSILHNGLEQLGFDFEAGRMDTGHTSMTVAIQPDDVRVAFPFAASELRNVFPKMFSEAGEASFSQNYETLLQGETDPSTKLAHRLLFEKFIGKSDGFWQLNYADIQKRLSPTLDHVSYEQFYEAINAVDFTIVKSEASEVMQPLHLLMRYEIEKAVINGEVATKELQNIWAEKSGEHLSLLTPHDLGGILQEDNFATGSFGAPGFELLSYMNAASMYQKLSQETKSWQNEDVKSWLQNNAYNVDGPFSPQALCKQDDLSAYLKVMEERFVPLYQN
ncbi:hypothetical protein [Geomicrobium sediminis]|uniref:Metal-dependent carboxypeptidase n=1 Tax=Geomicrobium sediminis TaxID=1347788 RepID=A0ABS2PD47_9BACL|nr:hypothetical protein [Geomicrobium sediminis]MBM7633367.1 carboxypeptidase Taq [Geomicrobium sediminis]